MVKLTPKDFSHIPPAYRPQRNIEVDANFAKKVKSIEKLGPRSNSENVGDVIMVLNNMQVMTPVVFKKKKKGTMKKSKGKGPKRSRFTRSRFTQRRDFH
jgi:hypothetical protein